MGPSLAPKVCYRWSCMGLKLAPWNANDGLAWAQCWPHQHATDDLAWAQCWLPQHATNDLAWAQPWPPSMLPMVWRGPVLATQHAANGLVWAQHWPQSMQLMVLHGPSAGRKVCY